MKIEKSFLISQSGGMRVRIVIVLVTLCIVGVAVLGLLNYYSQKMQKDYRRALLICEYGLMEGLQRLQENPSTTRIEIGKTQYKDGWYRVYSKKETKNDTVFLTLTAEGNAGFATEKRECILRMSIVNDDTVWVREEIY
ncbi:MAG: hypothetical protein N2053_07875 [Chitinispirillaceae bacterium]|nr:hypothetical protein [Chitinispirillaceae bacterium]